MLLFSGVTDKKQAYEAFSQESQSAFALTSPRLSVHAIGVQAELFGNSSYLLDLLGDAHRPGRHDPVELFDPALRCATVKGDGRSRAAQWSHYLGRRQCQAIGRGTVRRSRRSSNQPITIWRASERNLGGKRLVQK
jgi:hypothetical protein